MDNQKIDIKIKHLSGKTFNVSIESKATIDTLKAELEKQSKFPAAEIKLVFKGKILKNGDETLNDIGVTQDCTLHMIHKPTSAQTNPFDSQTNTNTNNTNNTPNTNQAPPPQNPFNGMNFGQGMGMPGMGMPGMGMPGMGMPGMGTEGQGRPNMGNMQEMMQNPQMRAMAQNLL